MREREPTTYDGVVAELRDVLERCSAEADRSGYFAAMYLAVTNTVVERARAGRFADAVRMERFVCRFAGRYLDAERAWRSGTPCRESWTVAFQAARRRRPIVLQHLLLGVNAHINLDLGVVAAEIGEGALDAVRGDFDAVNDVLAELVDGCQGALGEVSPWLALVDRIGEQHDESLIHFSLVRARRAAWTAATELAPLDASARAVAIERVDAATARLSRLVEHPGVLASALLLVVRLRERVAPGDVMRLLAAVRPVA